MKKKILSVVLSIIIAATYLPITALAAQDPNTSESKPVLLGTEAEYAGAFKTMFDENGLRMVVTGFNSDKGILNLKYGLINKYGNFVVSPIYDEIKLYAANYDYVENGLSNALPHYFIGGYTQAIRDGKMGLLNTNGEEVIPCQYDFVRLPSEGICAVYDKDGRLGYWSLDENREVVAPKYVPLKVNKLACITQKKPAGDYLGVHDFIDGYALVSYKDKTVNVIDKNGQEIFDKHYSVEPLLYGDSMNWETYPQKGAYLAFYEKKDGSSLRFAWDEGGTKQYSLKYPEYYATGLAGYGKEIIPATYTAGITTDMSGLRGNSLISTTFFQLIPEKNLIFTQYAPELDLLFESSYVGIDLKGNIVIPPNASTINYDQNAEVPYIYLGPLFTTTGKMVRDDSFRYKSFKNGYTIVNKAKAANNEITTYISKPDGTLFDVNSFLKSKDKLEVKSVEISDASVKGYFWVKDANNKWGLISFSGKERLPFVYDNVEYNDWHTGENGYAIVTKNGKNGVVNASGKLVADCIYDSAKLISKNGTAIALVSNNKTGLADLKKGKIILSAVYNQVGVRDIDSINPNCFAMGVYYVKKGSKYLLVNQKGKKVFSTKYKFSETGDGLYSAENIGGQFDNKGHIIFPSFLFNSANLEYADSYTIYLKDGNVYRCSVNYIDHSYSYKTYVPGNTASSSSSTKVTENDQNAALGAYEQEKYDAHKKAYKEAKKNPYKQKPIMKEEAVRFVSTPDMLEYTVEEPFKTVGFKVVLMDIYGDTTNITSEIVLKVDNTKIYDGYKFQAASEKTVNCYYNGKKLNSFKINVYEKVKTAELPLNDGNYYMMLMGKYVTPHDSTNRLELSDQKPEQPFGLTHLSIDKETGYHIYQISINDSSVEIDNNGQLAGTGSVNAPYKWRISKYTDFWTVRQENNQAMAVNASGASDKNGTKVIVWKHEGKAPENAKIQFVPVD